MSRLGFFLLILLIAGLAWRAYGWGKSLGERTPGAAPDTAPQTKEGRSMDQTLVANSPDGLTTGQLRLAGVDNLELSIVNGSVDVALSALPPGVVELKWEYVGRGVKPDPALEHIQPSLAQGTLLVRDWRKPDQGLSKSRNINLQLKLIHGPGISKLSGELANGDLLIVGNAACDVKLANGTLTLQGAPAGSMRGSVANGMIHADLLLAAGDSSLIVANGTLELSLRGKSSVAVEASTVTGEINGPQWLMSRRRNLTGATAQGALGTGAAQLELKVVNGSITVK